MVAALASVAAGLLVFGQPAAAQERTPEQTLAAFATALNRGEPDCSLMAADLRERFLYPSLLGDDPFSPQTWTAENQLKICARYVASYNGHAEEADNPEWTRTALAGIAVAERTDTLVRLSVRVKQYYRNARDNSDRRVSVWMQLEDGAWKLASHNQLLQFEDAPAPDSLAQWASYREALTRTAAAHRAAHEQQLQAALDATTTVAPTPLACAGRSSWVRDRTRDVVWSSGMDLVPDQRRPTIDMQTASLHSGAGKLCWQVRFVRDPGARFLLSVNLYRRSRGSSYPVQQEVLVDVVDGKARAGVPAPDTDEMEFLPVELSRTGNVVRLRLASSDLLVRRGRIDTRRPFRWGLQSFEANPSGVDDTSQWMDELPTVGSIGPTTGVLHRP